jgi:hypothetical protein
MLTLRRMDEIIARHLQGPAHAAMMVDDRHRAVLSAHTRAFSTGPYAPIFASPRQTRAYALEKSDPTAMSLRPDSTRTLTPVPCLEPVNTSAPRGTLPQPTQPIQANPSDLQRTATSLRHDDTHRLGTRIPDPPNAHSEHPSNAASLRIVTVQRPQSGPKQQQAALSLAHLT